MGANLKENVGLWCVPQTKLKPFNLRGVNDFVISISDVHVDNNKRRKIKVFASNKENFTREPQYKHLESNNVNVLLRLCASSRVSDDHNIMAKLELRLLLIPK